MSNVNDLIMKISNFEAERAEDTVNGEITPVEALAMVAGYLAALVEMGKISDDMSAELLMTFTMTFAKILVAHDVTSDKDEDEDEEDVENDQSTGVRQGAETNKDEPIDASDAISSFLNWLAE